MVECPLLRLLRQLVLEALVGRVGVSTVLPRVSGHTAFVQNNARNPPTSPISINLVVFAAGVYR